MSARDSIHDMRAAVERLTDSERRLRSAPSYLVTEADLDAATRELDEASAIWTLLIKAGRVGDTEERSAWLRYHAAVLMRRQVWRWLYPLPEAQ